MRYLYLVTRKADMIDFHYLDSLEIEGLFNTKSKAEERVQLCKKRDQEYKDSLSERAYDRRYVFDYTITEITVNRPFKNDEHEIYPSSWYEE